jgi:hypothetical protein
MADAGGLSYCGSMERRPQKGNLGKVIEMTSLQGGVLTVVCEAQEFSRFPFKLPVTLKFY